ncbi:Placenta-specific gene 8 protein, partial [Galemys pyrenaicus]
HNPLRPCIENASSVTSGHCDSTWRLSRSPNFRVADRPPRLFQRLRSICGTFCFVCLSCQIASDMNECCLCGTSVAMRTLYRTRYGIPGSICNDYMATLFCPTCSLCQIKRDINRRRAMNAF